VVGTAALGRAEGFYQQGVATVASVPAGDGGQLPGAAPLGAPAVAAHGRI